MTRLGVEVDGGREITRVRGEQAHNLFRLLSSVKVGARQGLKRGGLVWLRIS